MERQRLQAPGATPLALRIYTPETPATPLRASVVIGAAMGVRQAFYAPFAHWLAQQGFRVGTFDYQGLGDSQQGPLRQCRADLFDWARDYEAVIASAKAVLPDRPLYLIGHSLGAQLPGLLRQPELVDGLLGVAAGSGYWRDGAPQIRRLTPVFWWLLAPLATRLCGYFPGRSLRLVGDLPAGVIRQWRRWCLHPDYSVGAEGAAVAQSHGAVRFPVLSLFIADDEFMSLRGTQKLLALYAQAQGRIERIDPAEMQVRAIGHFGFFREQTGPKLWPRALTALATLAEMSPIRRAEAAADGTLAR